MYARKLKVSLAACALAFAAASAAAADYVILDSTAAGIDPGLVVAANAEIAIPEGAKIVLINPQGETLVVDGPFAGIVAAAASRGQNGVREALEGLSTTRGEDTTVLGAVRAPKIAGGSVTE